MSNTGAAALSWKWQAGARMGKVAANMSIRVLALALGPSGSHIPPDGQAQNIGSRPVIMVPAMHPGVGEVGGRRTTKYDVVWMKFDISLTEVRPIFSGR